jgi:hypothetical protein
VLQSGRGSDVVTRFVVTASPVDDLDAWPPTQTFYVEAETTSDAVELAGRLLSTKSAGLAVRSVVPRTGPLAGRTITAAPEADARQVLEVPPADGWRRQAASVTGITADSPRHSLSRYTLKQGTRRRRDDRYDARHGLGRSS